MEARVCKMWGQVNHQGQSRCQDKNRFKTKTGCGFWTNLQHFGPILASNPIDSDIERCFRVCECVCVNVDVLVLFRVLVCAWIKCGVDGDSLFLTWFIVCGREIQFRPFCRTKHSASPRLHAPPLDYIIHITTCVKGVICVDCLLIINVMRDLKAV